MKICALAFLAALLPALTLSAQQAAPAPAPAATPTVGPDSPRTITLDVTVTPKAGGPNVTGLAQSDFTLLDNKKARPISSFRAVSAAQGLVEFILMLDTVNIPYTEVSYIRKQLQDFLQANPHLPYPTSIGVLTDKGAKIAPGFTTDGKAISEVLGQFQVGLRAFNSDSGFYADQQRMQTSLAAARELTGYTRSLPGRKVVVWISPGWPLLGASDTKIDERMQNITFREVVDLAAQMRQSRLTFYVINPLGSAEATSRTFAFRQYINGLDKPVNAKAGNLGLQVIATQSGGLVYTGKTDVIAQLMQTFDDAASWYELTFKVPPADQPNEYRPIQVNLGNPSLTARTLAGYYAQP